MLYTLNPICICGFHIETLNHFFLDAQELPMKGKFLLKSERIILRKIDTSITPILLYGDRSFSAEFNTNILSSSIDYISSTKRFQSTLFTQT